MKKYIILLVLSHTQVINWSIQPTHPKQIYCWCVNVDGKSACSVGTIFFFVGSGSRRNNVVSADSHAVWREGKRPRQSSINRGEWRNDYPTFSFCNNGYLGRVHSGLRRLFTLAARSAAVRTRLLRKCTQVILYCSSLGLLEGNAVTLSACPEWDVSFTALCGCVCGCARARVRLCFKRLAYNRV